MGRKCGISVCMSDSNREEDRGVTFHKIPMHPDIRPKWMSLCRIPEDKKFMKVIYVCSRHFLKVDFCHFKGKKYMLRQGVLPSVFPWNKNKIEVKQEKIKGEIEESDRIDGSNEDATVKSEGVPDVVPQIKFEVTEQDFNESTSLALKSEEGILDMANLKEEVVSPNQSTTIEQKVKTVETTTGPLTFAPNTRIEALDFNQAWCPAQIVEVDYQENEVLVHFEKYSNKYDEWICMNSSTLRALPTNASNTSGTTKKIETYEIGERCLATWNNARKFPATVAKIIDKDTYEVHFDDGYVKVLKAHRMSKATGKSLQASPLFDPVRSTKQERRERKRKINVAALFGKRPRANSQEDVTGSRSVDSSVTSPYEETESWTPKWENGRPVGEESTIETIDGPRPSVIVPDPRLPPHWVKHLSQRNHGASAGKWNSFIVNPDGRKFRTRTELKAYIEEKPELNLTESMFDFSIYKKSRKSMSERKHHPPITEPALPRENSPCESPIDEESKSRGCHTFPPFLIHEINHFSRYRAIELSENSGRG
ncbi:THAP domain [Popillia japonica]|uniref:THAP domain n=1 Tax=Popillia japonica TaxID=7064 RepID=A0AAW1K1K6_POPJA